MIPRSEGGLASEVGARIRRAYTRIRILIVYLLAAVTILTSLLPTPKLQLNTLVVLLAASLSILIDVLATAKRGRSQRFANLAQAVPKLKACCEAAYRQDSVVRLQVIGMTMFNAWNSYEQVLDWLADHLRAKKVIFEVAMLTKEWLDCHKINPSWTGDSADENARRIQSYKERNPTRLEGLDWIIDVRRYEHMPSMHGVLINGKVLFEGNARWEEGYVMRAGDRPFELHALKDGEGGTDHIVVFQRWFNLCFGDKPDWYPRASTTHDPGATTDAKQESSHHKRRVTRSERAIRCFQKGKKGKTV